MNQTRFTKLSYVLLLFVLVACQAQATPTAAPVPSSPPAAEPSATQASDEFALAGDPIPDNLLNVDYFLVDGNPPVVIRLREREDPQCVGMNAVENCFTILRVDNSADPGARGPAAIINGQVALLFQIVPYGPDDVGSIEYFEPQEDGGVLVGVKCETKTGAECNADVGSTWKLASQQTTFSPKTFDLPITVRYGHEWRVAEEYSDVFTLSYTGHDAGVSFINIKNAKIGDGIAFPDDFVTWLQSPDSLFQVEDSKPVLVGGFKGTQINAIGTCGEKKMWIILSGTGWWCPSGGHIGFIYLDDVNGERILIEVQGSPDDKDYMFIVDEAQKVLDTVVFSKP